MDINNLTLEELKIVKDAINQKINQLGDNTSQEETLEEAAKKDYDYQSFIKGANWQAKRMYSEEEVLEQLNILMSLPSSTLDKFTDDNGNITIKWFEQFKKK
jgi:hypothetical protein